MNNRTAPGAQNLSQASRLDRLILAESCCDPDNPGITAYIGADPSGVLSEYMLHEAEHVVVVSDVRSEVDRAVSLAVELQMRGKIWARGIDGPINLDDFLQEYAKGHEPGLGVLVTHLPKSLSHLEYLAQCAARAGVGRFVGAHNTKHMNRSQNQALASAFDDVRASRGSGKFRALVATRPRKSLPEPAVRYADGLYAFGATFAGVVADHGGQLMARHAIADWAGEEPATVLDFGCGNGAVSRALLEAGIGFVSATDISADAVESTKLTLVEYKDRVDVSWDTSAQCMGDESVGAVLLNPPFHDGFAVDDSLVDDLLIASRRLLMRDGRLYIVFNSHLRYRPIVERLFTQVAQLARDSRFTVLRARKRS
ncbi:Ribosomal RNA large subunit methyltransferase G [Arcanobacterium haemolyticum]|uniref:class I SAM-dependent methyltransferase n=1 Tax=Arcanobacterium haemolyticum TaxID=28264 RepID=UPI000D9DDC93|nr:methyltransferase [Arcanobacterium haemolyticum]SPT75817.1 Ribosomal RNA large subunit methyltransferase G [Arcanobacterium haemolyticum]